MSCGLVLIASNIV